MKAKPDLGPELIVGALDGPLIGTAEIARFYGVSAFTIRRWAALRKIPHWRSPTGRLLFERPILVRPDPTSLAASHSSPTDT